MVTAARYFDLVRELNNPYNHFLRLVKSAKQGGIKHVAQLFAATARTVRNWLRRYQQRGNLGLVEQSRARHHQSQKTPPAVKARKSVV